VSATTGNLPIAVTAVFCTLSDSRSTVVGCDSSTLNTTLNTTLRDHGNFSDAENQPVIRN